MKRILRTTVALGVISAFLGSPLCFAGEGQRTNTRSQTRSVQQLKSGQGATDADGAQVKTRTQTRAQRHTQTRNR